VKRRILIGYDGSPNSDDALELGRRLCEALDATPLVACCVLWPRYLLDQPELGEAVEEDTKPILDRAVERLAPTPAQTCSLYDDSAAFALQKLAIDVDPLLVVVGSAHRGRIGRILLGSTGLALVTGSPSPVVVAPRGYAKGAGDHLLRVGVAVDGGDESGPALESAIAVAERLHATLTVFGVLTPTPTGYGTMAGAAMGDLMRSQREHFASALEDAADRVPRSLPVEILRSEGRPAAKIAEASTQFDLLFVGSRAYGPLGRVLLGSVSSELMRTAACPLVVIPKGVGALDAERDGAQAE
jgi:nucleotide-binding universal stress UspA family protein